MSDCLDRGEIKNDLVGKETNEWKCCILGWACATRLVARHSRYVYNLGTTYLLDKYHGSINRQAITW
jgi:hypothetical protein